MAEDSVTRRRFMATAGTLAAAAAVPAPAGAAIAAVAPAAAAGAIPSRAGLGRAAHGR